MYSTVRDEQKSSTGFTRSKCELFRDEFAHVATCSYVLAPSQRELAKGARFCGLPGGARQWMAWSPEEPDVIILCTWYIQYQAYVWLTQCADRDC